MKDSLGWRLKLGVVTPSVNACVQPEFDAMRPPGVTNHISRMYMRDALVTTDDRFHSVIKEIDEALEPAVVSVMTCKPDHLIVGVSIEAVWGGHDGARAVAERIRKHCPVGITMASDAIPAALKALNVGKRVALVCPYRDPGVLQVRKFLDECGFEVVRGRGIPHGTSSELSHISKLDLVRELKDIDGDDVDGIVQFGANIAMAAVAGEAERWLEKPVIAVNTALYWHALRANGLTDVVEGFGSLLERH
jgi:maleate isomerase